MKIAFIGLGNMGLPMAKNLVKHGHTVVGFDPALPSSKELNLAKTAIEAVRDAEVVITMLPNGRVLNVVYREIVPTVPASAAST